MPKSQTAALPINQEEEERGKTKQAQIEQTYHLMAIIFYVHVQTTHNYQLSYAA